MIGDAIPLDRFLALVDSGSIMHDDGCTGSIFVNDVDQVRLYIRGWGLEPIHPVQQALMKSVELEGIKDMFPGKQIFIEWCNK